MTSEAHPATTSQPLDLDHVEAWANHTGHSAADCERGDKVMLRLVAEVRAARKCVDILRRYDDPPDDPLPREDRKALTAYDEAVGGK